MFIIIYSVGASHVEESFPSFIIIDIEDAPLIEYLTRVTSPLKTYYHQPGHNCDKSLKTMGILYSR